MPWAPWVHTGRKYRELEDTGGKSDEVLDGNPAAAVASQPPTRRRRPDKIRHEAVTTKIREDKTLGKRYLMIYACVKKIRWL